VFWHLRVNDEGVPKPNGFLRLASQGKIGVTLARATGFTEKGVILNDGTVVEADTVILATGFTSTWQGIFDGELEGKTGQNNFSSESLCRGNRS
jgi:dimethylaniline monooxygenase (N-oxide forming)